MGIQKIHCLKSVKEHFGLLTPYNSFAHFSLCVCVRVFSIFHFLSGNDSVVAPSTDSHPHPLQNRALQVSIPYQGQHCTSACVDSLIQMIVS